MTSVKQSPDVVYNTSTDLFGDGWTQRRYRENAYPDEESEPFSPAVRARHVAVFKYSKLALNLAEIEVFGLHEGSLDNSYFKILLV